MVKINQEQVHFLKDILGKKWKKIPLVDKIEWDTFGVRIKGDNIIGLGLYNRNLAKLPESIGNLTSLQVLSLFDNSLTTLPESISDLKSIQRLDLNVNKITTLPESIGNLSSLQELNLYRNNLTTLPESIGNLSSLQVLSLDENPLNQEYKKIFKMANGDVQFFLRKILERKAIEKKHKKERIIIEKLIREKNFSNAFEELNRMRKIARENFLPEILNWTEKNLKICNKPVVKKSVLDLGIKFARLQIAEISEVCGVDDVQLIVDVVKDMIDNKEIYAQYFSSTKSVAFDQQANIDEIDKLMSTYKDWEDREIGKK